MMALVILGGCACNIPSVVSDRYDRRLVILLLCAVLTLLALLMVLLPEAGASRRGDSGLPAGGMAFSIYPLSLSHACDELRPDQVLGANQGLLLAYSLGAMTGRCWPPLSWQFGTRGAVRLLRPVRSAAVGLSRLAQAQRAPIPLAEHQVFMPVPPNTPMTAELEPRTDLEGEAVPASYAVPDAEEER
jgi:hypothetical protein